MAAAEVSLCGGRKKQPDCFFGTADILAPFLKAKNTAHMKVLETNFTQLKDPSGASKDC